MKTLFKMTLCLSLSLSVYTPDAFGRAAPASNPSHGGGKQCKETQRLVAQCQADGRAAASAAGVTPPPDQTRGLATTGAAAAGIARAQTAAAAERCRKSKEECDQKCKTDEEKRECAGAVLAAAGTMQQQSNSLGGDMGGMLAAAAMMGAAALPLLMKKDEEEEQPGQMAQDPNNALRPDGTFDCSKPNAFMYPQCDAKLAETSCKTAIEDQRCRQVAGRYCNSQAGIGSDFCNTVVAYDFCKTGANDMCPSCLQLKKESSQYCIDNPAACLAQNSPEETEKMRATCPGDPAFYGNNQPVQVAGPPAAGGGAIPAPNPSLPAPILPAGGAVANNGGTNGSGGGIANPNGGGGTIAVSSVNPPTQNGGGYNPSSASASSGAGGSNRATGSGGGILPSSLTQRGVASSNSGLPPDINGQFAPSLFATSSQVIRARCANGQFNHCP